jgi:hypothetical protein
MCAIDFVSSGLAEHSVREHNAVLYLVLSFCLQEVQSTEAIYFFLLELQELPPVPKIDAVLEPHQIPQSVGNISSVS